MKGLVYKEFYLGKKNLLTFVIVTIMFAVLGVLVCLSMNFGNLHKLADGEGMRSYYAKIFFYVPYLILLLSTETCINSVFRDYSISWMDYSYTLPLSGKKTIGAKYIFLGGISLAALVFGIIYSALISDLSGVDYSFKVLKIQFIIFVVAFLANAMMLALAYLVRTKNRMVTIEVIFFAILYLAFGAIAVWGEEKYGLDESGNSIFGNIIKEKLQNIGDIIGPVIPVIVIGWMIVWFFAATRIYLRREKA